MGLLSLLSLLLTSVELASLCFLFQALRHLRPGTLVEVAPGGMCIPAFAMDPTGSGRNTTTSSLQALLASTVK